MSMQSHDIHEHPPGAERPIRDERSPRQSEPDRIPATKARQGGIGRPVLVVLIVGLILAALAWWGAEIYGKSIESQHVIEQPARSTAPSGG